MEILLKDLIDNKKVDSVKIYYRSIKNFKKEEPKIRNFFKFIKEKISKNDHAYIIPYVQQYNMSYIWTETNVTCNFHYLKKKKKENKSKKKVHICNKWTQ